MYGGLFVLDKSFDVFQSRTLILEENDHLEITVFPPRTVILEIGLYRSNCYFSILDRITKENIKMLKKMSKLFTLPVAHLIIMCIF